MKSLVILLLCMSLRPGLPFGVDNPVSPSITTATYDSYGRITISWTGDSTYSSYTVRVSQGTDINSHPAATVDVGPAQNFTYRPLSVGAYTLAVTGCFGPPVSKTTACQGQSAPVTLNATALPPAKFITLPFPHTASGDCELDSATVSFWSNGSGVFKAQVKTNHTNSGDVFHATIAAANSAKQDVIRLSTFDSVRMNDTHGYYPWTQSFEFDPTKFSQIASINMLARC